MINDAHVGVLSELTFRVKLGDLLGPGQKAKMQAQSLSQGSAIGTRNLPSHRLLNQALALHRPCR